MPSSIELELALAEQARERERALRHAALVREARAAAPKAPAWRPLVAFVAALATRLAPQVGAPAANRGVADPLRLETLGQARAAAPDDQRAQERAA